VPLSDDERRELIRMGLQKNLAPDQIFQALQHADEALPDVAPVPSGGASPVKAAFEPEASMGPQEPPGIVEKAVRFGSDLFGPNTPADLREKAARQAMDIIGTGLFAEVGGGAARPLATKLIGKLALKKGILPWAARTGASMLVPTARAAGTFVGDVGTRAATGQPVDVPGAAERAGGQLALETGFGQAGRMLARAGGVGPEAAAAAQAEGRLPYMKPKGEAPLLRPTSIAEFKGMGQEVAEAAHEAGDIAGAPHAAYMDLVNKNANRQIDAGPIMTAVRSKISGAAIGPNRTADVAMTRAIRDLRSKLKPGGMITIKDADDWVRANLTPLALKAQQTQSEAAISEAADAVRKKIVPYLYGKVSSAAGSLQQATKDMLTKQGAVETFLPEQTAYQPNLSTPQKLRQALAETETGQEVRDRLGTFDTAFGTRLLPKTQRLAMRESWAPLNQEDMGRMIETMHPGGSPGLMLRAGKAAARGPGKFLTKAARPSGRLLTAYLQAMAAKQQAQDPMANP
jgi:hypothetical protein